MVLFCAYITECEEHTLSTFDFSIYICYDENNGEYLVGDARR